MTTTFYRFDFNIWFGGYCDLHPFPEPENEDDFEEEEYRQSEPQGPGTMELPLAAVEHQVDVLLEEWNKGADMLFSIHPMDGSLLVWHVDWLDEYHPGMFRQAQVCMLLMHLEYWRSYFTNFFPPLFSMVLFQKHT